MDRSGRLSRHRPDVGVAGRRALVVVARRAARPGRLPDRRRRLRHGDPQLQRGRRRHRALQRGSGRGCCPTTSGSASVDGVADDWPLTYDELRPHYEETDRQFGVSGLGGNPAYPPGEDPPLPPLPIGEIGLRVARAHHRLGWHWWPATNAIASAPYEGRHVCVRRGTCGQGCNEGAKGSTDVTHWPRSAPPGACSSPGRGCGASSTDPDGLALGAEWIDRDGREQFTPAADSCWSRPTPSAPLGSCWPRPTPATPTGWPTPPDSSVAGSCCIRSPPCRAASTNRCGAGGPRTAP